MHNARFQDRFSSDVSDLIDAAHHRAACGEVAEGLTLLEEALARYGRDAELRASAGLVALARALGRYRERYALPERHGWRPAGPRHGHLQLMIATESVR